MAWFITTAATWAGYLLIWLVATVVVVVAIKKLLDDGDERRQAQQLLGKQQERLRIANAALLFSEDLPTQSLLLDIACVYVEPGSDRQALGRWRGNRARHEAIRRAVVTADQIEASSAFGASLGNGLGGAR